MSQTDYARRRQCVPPPSVKGRRSVFPRRIAGEAVFFTVFKTDPEKNTSTKTSAPFTIAYELPPAIRAWVWIAGGSSGSEPRGGCPAIRAWVWIAGYILCPD